MKNEYTVTLLAISNLMIGVATLWNEQKIKKLQMRVDALAMG